MQFREILPGKEEFRKNAICSYTQKEQGDHECGCKHAASTETWRVIMLLVGNIQPVIQIIEETISVFLSVLHGVHLLEMVGGFVSVFHIVKSLPTKARKRMPNIEMQSKILFY